MKVKVQTGSNRKGAPSLLNAGPLADGPQVDDLDE